MEIKKVGVLGCGVMGGQIAAHLTNVGLDVIAFDLDDVTAQKGVEATKTLKPSPYYNLKTADNITGEIYKGLWHDIGTPERLNSMRKNLSL